jgi:hypothetical protein
VLALPPRAAVSPAILPAGRMPHFSTPLKFRFEDFTDTRVPSFVRHPALDDFAKGAQRCLPAADRALSRGEPYRAALRITSGALSSAASQSSDHHNLFSWHRRSILPVLASCYFVNRATARFILRIRLCRVRRVDAAACPPQASENAATSKPTAYVSKAWKGRPRATETVAVQHLRLDLCVTSRFSIPRLPAVSRQPSRRTPPRTLALRRGGSPPGAPTLRPDIVGSRVSLCQSLGNRPACNHVAPCRPW